MFVDGVEPVIDEGHDGRVHEARRGKGVHALFSRIRQDEVGILGDARRFPIVFLRLADGVVSPVAGGKEQHHAQGQQKR